MTHTSKTVGTENVSIRDWPKIVAIINALPNPPRRQLYFGKPGSGKTTYACSLVAQYERVTLNEAQFADALLGKFLLKDGSTEWVNAFASRAALRGCPLILDEIHKAGTELDSTLNSILDDESVCALNLDNGQTITPAPGYRVIATMNGSPDQLSEPLLDRFDVVLRCDTPHEGILHRLSPESSAYLLNKMANEPATAEEWVPKQSTRNFISFENLRKEGLSDELAAEIVFGEGQGKTVLMSMIDAARNRIGG
jgi:MoxR-like ATPase